MPAAGAVASSNGGTTVTGSTTMDSPVVRSINARIPVPQRNDTTVLTSILAAITRPKPNGDMNNCSRVPHWASRVAFQARPEKAVSAIVAVHHDHGIDLPRTIVRDLAHDLAVVDTALGDGDRPGATVTFELEGEYLEVTVDPDARVVDVERFRSAR